MMKLKTVEARMTLRLDYFGTEGGREYTRINPDAQSSKTLFGSLAIMP